jgi:hypothetical protein
MSENINEYFTHPDRIRPQAPLASSFEQVVKALRLSPEQYTASNELRAWVKRNKNLRYVPPELLAAFGFEESEVRHT